ncbi:MAG: 16S rRNA (cytosine(967)-C(5))-methyltransferase [Kaiparowitsia implicata GSE-PSE-MK54-09C]|nr:16S rRNA (cytosine(967)-C(5))-methyltransferase [Kaiparowitsia implicata GSE-PSE-MK54-09C]
MGDRSNQTLPTRTGSSSNPRQVALLALLAVQRGAFADVALHDALNRADLSAVDRGLTTELVYGTVRRGRSLNALIQQFASKPPPPKLVPILQLGLYQLRYLSHIPPSAAVNTTVDLAKHNGLGGLAGFVNGLLRAYGRSHAAGVDPLDLPSDPVQRLGVLHSYPDWIVQVWVDQVGWAAAEALCQWFNQPPRLDVRVNELQTSVTQVQQAWLAAGVESERLPQNPQGLRLRQHIGAVQALPGFAEGWWAVQDSSAQLVSHLLDPQPGETVIDACAAPGGKTTHIAELMGDRGVVWAGDRSANRLKKVAENAQRLRLHSIHIQAADSRELPQFAHQADRVLLDVPCSGLGTLHRHADARWRQTPETILPLAQLQQELLSQAATWVKPGGLMVYSTCTLHPVENEAVIQAFLAQHPTWQIEPPPADNPAAAFAEPPGWCRVWPHQHDMDGFFMVRLRAAIA